jgi:hypothetical protein
MTLLARQRRESGTIFKPTEAYDDVLLERASRATGTILFGEAPRSRRSSERCTGQKNRVPSVDACASGASAGGHHWLR